MKIDTAWVAPPNIIGGLDHVGTQGPCVLLYTQLLPGITNVTDRARYYSFYTWFIWSFAKRPASADYAHFIDLYRRADCLFTLIAERHARVMADTDPELHGPAMVGRDELTPAVTLLDAGHELALSTYATSDPAERTRYFANKLGGLGQYYRGTLYQLGLLQTMDRSWIAFTEDLGQPLAEAFDAGVPATEFWRVLEGDTITAAHLDSLSAFCPCAMCASKAEHNKLLDIFFDRKGQYAEEGTQRRKTLGLILDIANALRTAQGPDLDAKTFRMTVYTGTLPNGTPWSPPERLAATRQGWKTYVRNDTFSVIVQATFSIDRKSVV